MSQQNPWKKMMNLKPAKAPKVENQNNNSPINQFMKEGNSSPSWVKNNSNSPQQPPWANKGGIQTKPTQSNTQPPWAKNTVQTNNQPPWAKNNQNAAQNNNQPPWAKNNTNTPPWIKNNQNETNATNNQPAWMKNNQPATQNSNSPSWVKDKDPGNTPPWIKGNSNTQSGTNMWKSKKAAEIQKQKKQFEEKFKREEEEQKQRKRLQKQRKEKEQEQNNIKRELEAMAKEEEYSIARQTYQKQEAQRIQRERIQQQQRLKEQEQRRLKEEQQARRLREQEEEKQRLQEQERKRLQQQQERKRLEQNQRLQNERLERQRLAQLEKTQKTKREDKKKPTRKKKIQNLQTSKISHISSIKGFQQMGRSQNEPSMPQNFYHRYLRLINEQSQENDYKVKIQLQKSIYQVQLQFKKECETELVNLFTSRKVNNRKRKLIFSNSMQIQYALCEGKKQQEKLEFITEEIQQLRTRFMHYELLTKCVLNLMRKKINLRLRVPLLNLAQYKGVTFLIEYVCHELVDFIEIEIGLFQEIANEVLIFQKELELQQDGRSDVRPISKDQLMVKKISVYGQDYYILYLKNQLKSAAKSKKNESSSKLLSQSIQKISQMNDLTFLEYIIGQNNILPYYQPPLPISKALHQQISKIGSPTVKRITDCINASNAINIVYSSCQGQVNQESFFQLVVENNKELANMISNAGNVTSKVPDPLALSYLEKLTAVYFNFSAGMYKQKSKELIKRIKPNVYIQRHQFQLIQFVKNMEKYITQDKQELVDQCLSLGRRLWQDINNNQSSETFNFIRFKNQISYLLFKQQQKEAIELIQKTRQTMDKFCVQRIPLDLLALKIYVSKNMEIPMLKLLSELLETLEFYFGEQSIIHAFVYTIIGSYYSKETEEPQTTRSQKVITFYQHALNIALKQNGQKALQVADIYLSRAEAFLNLADYGQFEKDIQNALKIYKMHSKSAPKIAQCNLLQGRAKCAQGKISQGLELMEVSSNQFMKMYNYIESLCILFQTLSFLQNKESELQIKIEKIVEICFTYKSVWAFRRISTLVIDKELNCYTSLTLHNLQELFHPLQPDDRTNEEVMIDLEDQIKGFTSFIEIVRWGLSIIAAKLTSRRQATNQYEKAHSIIGQIFHFYSKNQTMSMELKDSQII